MSIISKNRKKVILSIIVLISVILRVASILVPIGNERHSFRQAETAIVVQNFLNDGCSFLHYQIPVLGQPWEIPFEFPIYQAVVYGVMKMLNQTNIDLWCRIVSLFIFYLSALVLYKVTSLVADKQVSLCVCGVYLYSPFTILWSRAALIDYMSVLFALLYVYGMYSWLIDRKRRKIIVAFVFGCAAYLLKATTMFPYVFLLAFLILDYFIKSIKGDKNELTLSEIKKFVSQNIVMMILLGIVCIVPVIPGIVWTKYADMVKANSIYTDVLTSSALKYWNYGSPQQKLDWNNWKVILKRLLDFMGGWFPFLFLLGNYVIFRTRKYTFVLISCLFSVIFTIGILFNLYYVHDYYIIAISPHLSIALGIMIFVAIKILYSEGNLGKVLIEVICVTMLMGQVNCNREYINDFLKGDEKNNNAGLYVNKITTPDERILIEGEDWSPVTMYYANRKGLMLTGWGEYPMEEFYHGFIKEENYTTLVAHSVNYIDEFSNTQDILIQYPKYNDVHVYKFFDRNYFTDVPYQETIYISGEQRDYQLQNPNPDTILIEYDDSLAGNEVEMIIVDKEGKQYSEQIYLLKNKKMIYFRISVVSGNIDKISFVFNSDDQERI